MVLTAVTAGAARQQEPDLFDEIFRKSEPVRASLETLTARITETTTSSLLTRPLVERGAVVLIRPSRVRLTYESPDERIITIDDNRLTVDWPSRELHETKDIGAAQRRIQRYFVDATPDELRSHFRIAASMATDRAGTYLVTMLPKRKQILQGMTKLELWVDQTSFLPRGMRLTFPSGDTKLMTFDDVKLNPPVDWEAVTAAHATPDH